MKTIADCAGIKQDTRNLRVPNPHLFAKNGMFVLFFIFTLVAGEFRFTATLSKASAGGRRGGVVDGGEYDVVMVVTGLVVIVVVVVGVAVVDVVAVVVVAGRR